MVAFVDNNKEIFLVLRAQTGDASAFDELFKDVQAPFYGYIKHMVGNPQVAEDILQEVFLIVYRKIKWLDDPKLFRPWCYRIASRQCFKHLKTESRRGSYQIEEDELNAIAQPTAAPEYDPEIAARLPSLLERLSPESRSAIALHYLSEFSLRETAEILNVSTGTAKSRVAYGLKLLRKLLEREVRHK